ncbi:MAG: glycosyltransferase family 4 protein [Ilumatobacter sp.]|uniref:glycosyltransferase family 4 protein n=1 Tax=Ilumatobacter sp. TaxID=1967498 RepID=UPI003919D924
MLSVAIDVGPLHGPRTGVGNAVAWSIDELRRLGAAWGDEHEHGDAEAQPFKVQLLPYLTSMRSRVSPPTRRLPLPAAAAHRLWQRADRPHLDRWLGRPDLVHGTNYVVPPTRCPRLVSVYDCWFLEHPGDASPDVARAGEILRRSIGSGAHVVTSSQATADRLREFVPTDRLDVIHLGPPPVDATPSDAAMPSATPPRFGHLDGASFVVSIGTVERRKNVPSLVRAFGRLAAEHAQARLVVAGRPGDDQAEVDRALADLDPATRARVDTFGQISSEEKRWLLAHATALAYPSLDEGFGFPILEAQQAGVPVVASSAGSIPEVAGTGALLSAPLDTEALAANLHWVLTSDHQRQILIDKGTRNLDRFSWTTTARSYFDLYARLSAP